MSTAARRNASKAFYERNREKIKERQRAYYAENREKILAAAKDNKPPAKRGVGRPIGRKVAS